MNKFADNTLRSVDKNFEKYLAFCESQDPYDLDLSVGSDTYCDLLNLYNTDPYEIINQLIDMVEELQ